jgi:hypothetical protein
MILPVFDRFMMNVTEQPDGCWLWTAGVRWGKEKFEGQSPQRFSYLFHNKVLPRNKDVAPTCGNDLCVAPEHLVLKDRVFPKKEKVDTPDVRAARHRMKVLVRMKCR